MNERSLAIFRLHLTGGVGALTYKKLVRAFGSPEGALAAPRSRLAEIDGIGGKRASLISEARNESAERAEEELALAEEHGVRVTTLEDKGYPRALRTIHDPPLALYVKGAIEKRDGLALAIVGSRRSSYYGRSQTENIAAQLAGLGFTIVSGMARGIDSAAHRGALAGKGRTIAVLGNGLAQVYPPENEELAREIAAHGAVVSEFPMKTEPVRENFPRRNRVISGLALGVLVAEGNLRSGALITARAAMEQGREVFALPGKVDSPLSRGPHSLIKDGAKLVEGHQDILDELGPSADVLELGDEEGQVSEEQAAPAGGEEGAEVAGPAQQERTATGEDERDRPGPAKAFPGLSPSERKLHQCLSSDPRSIDDITEETEMSPAEVSAGLLVLEIRRLAKQLPGKMFVRLR